MATIVHAREERLARGEIISRIEREARRRRGVSGTELVSAYRAGRLADPGSVADLIVLSDLLSDDDPFVTGRPGPIGRLVNMLRGRSKP